MATGINDVKSIHAVHTAPPAAGTSIFASETAFESADKVRSILAPQLLRRFLIPLDGTREGEQALPFATTLARATHARLVLGHVTPTDNVNKLAQLLHLAGSEQQAAQQAFAPEVLAYLQELRWQLAIPLDQVDTLHMSASTVADGLLEIISMNAIDLVIARLQVHYYAGNLSLGTIIDTLLRKSAAPLLVIPPEAEATQHPFTLRHILVPLDGSVLAEEALPLLLGLLAQTQYHPEAPLVVTLLGVAENYVVLPHYQTYLDTMCAGLLAEPVCAQVQIQAKAIVGSAPGAIVGAVGQSTSDDINAQDPSSEEPVDLLLMATHGRGGMQRWLFGSVADYVLPRVGVPVMLAHPIGLTK